MAETQMKTPIDGERPERVRARSPLEITLRRTMGSGRGKFGVRVILAAVLVAIFAPLIAPHDPLLQVSGAELQAPSATYLFGTDHLGRDIASRVIYGTRVSILVGILAAALGAGVGTTLGLVAGYFGGVADAVIMRFCDALHAFPTILLGIAVATALGPGMTNVAYAIALAQLPNFARVTRAAVLVEKRRNYVLASISLGAGPTRVLTRHILPNCLSPLLVQLTLTMTYAILIEAGLSFLGLGAQPPTPTWGGMLADSRAYLQEAPWIGFWPGMALAVLLLGLNFLQEAIRDALDPRHISK